MPPGDFGGPSIFHVGLIKTATTYLQHQVFGPDRFGCGLPGGAHSRAHLVEWFITDDAYLYDPGRIAREIDALEAPLRAAGRVPVWSDETLLGNPVTRIYNGRAVLEKIAALPRDKKIVITIREQRAMCLSIFREFVKQGGGNPLEHVIGTGAEPRSFTPLLRPDYLMYDRVASWCAGTFGPDNVLILPIEMLRTEPERYFARLFEFIGAETDARPGKDPVNVGLGAVALGLNRRLNRFDIRNPLDPAPSLTRRATVRLVRLTDHFCPRRADRAIEERWRAAIEVRYRDLFTESNRQLAERTGLDLASYGYR